PLTREVRAVFEHWVQVMGKGPRAVLQGKREANVRARLREGYTVEQLCAAVDGCKLSPHHQGANEQRTVYDDLELICRTPQHVDRFLGIAKGPSSAPTSTHSTGALAELEAKRAAVRVQNVRSPP